MKFHHIGYATENIESELLIFESLGYGKRSGEFTDSLQGVKGCFLEDSFPRIELLENLPGSETLTPWLEAGIKAYHFAYEVKNLSITINKLKAKRALLVSSPSPSVAFGGREICFLMLRNRQLVELIQASIGCHDFDINKDS